MITGKQSIFAFEVGEIGPHGPDLRRVYIWGGGHLLTCEDNTVYIPQFSHSVEKDIEKLKSPSSYLPPPIFTTPIEAHRQFNISEGDAFRDHMFMNWGPTSDNISSLLFRRERVFHMTLQFCRQAEENIYEVILQSEELIHLLTNLAKETRKGHKQIGIGLPIAEEPSHTTVRTDRVYGGSAGQSS